MHEVHPPQEAVHSWRGFLLHIATIVIGLLIAVGLEQPVEAIHDRHQRHLLEEQTSEVFKSNLSANEVSFQQLKGLRAYLTDLRAAIIARQRGQSTPAQPPVDDPRMATFPRFPNLAPYEAAQENGTIALLPTDRIRIYNRVAYQRELLGEVRNHWLEGLAAISAFQERYVDSTGSLAVQGISIAPDLSTLTVAERGEYLAIVAALIKQVDMYVARLHLLDLQCRAILDGVRDEDELIRLITSEVAAGAGAAQALPKHPGASVA